MPSNACVPVHLRSGRGERGRAARDRVVPARRRLLAGGTVLALTVTALVAVAPAAMAASVTQTFAYTGAEQTFTIPAGVTSVRVTASGGRGGAGTIPGGTLSPGGIGGEVAASFTVTAGAVLSVTVAGDAGTPGPVCGAVYMNGCGGYGGGGQSKFAGGGGGASSVRIGEARLVVAGGGGGAANRSCSVSGGSGGAAGSPGTAGEDCTFLPLVLGGGRGGLAGSPGNDAGAGGIVVGGDPCFEGPYGPRFNAGQAGSDGAGTTGGASTLDQGGGAGGGGYDGGGSGGQGAYVPRANPCGGGEEAPGGGGGGGSSYVDPVGLNPVIGLSSRTEANGLVTISYTVPDTTLPVVTVPANLTVAATGPAGATVTYAATATDDETAGLTPVCDPASETLFPVGTTTVTCRATDAAGNTGSASFTVTVTAPPVNAADLTVRVTGPGSVRTNTQVTYTVTVTNTGPAAAAATKTVLGAAGVATTSTTPVTGTGTLKIRATTLTGALWTGATIAAGQSVTYTLTGKVTAKPGNLVGVAAGALSSTPDPALAGNIAATATRVTT